MKKTYNCKSCGGKDISFDAEAKWNDDKQEFEFGIIKFYYEEKQQGFCNVCENWTEFEINDLE